jgi:hypothetical protein
MMLSDLRLPTIKLSYDIYLAHTVVIGLVERWIGSPIALTVVSGVHHAVRGLGLASNDRAALHPPPQASSSRLPSSSNYAWDIAS